MLEEFENPALQKRSAATRNRIVKAVASFVEKGEYDTVTVGEIVDKAGVSVGAFYGRFKDKDAALFVIAHEQADILDGKAARLFQQARHNENPLNETLEKLINLVTGHTFQLAPLYRTLAFRATITQADHPFVLHTHGLSRKMVGRVTRLLADHAHEHRHPQYELAAQMCLSIISSVLRDTIVSNPQLLENPSTLNAFKQELLRAIRGYLSFERNKRT